MSKFLYDDADDADDDADDADDDRAITIPPRFL